MNKALFSRGPWKHIVNRTTISDADGDRIATCHELQNRIEKLLGKACGSDSASETAPARQIWHERTDIPETGNRIVLVVTTNKTWIKMPVCDLIAFLRGIHRPMIRRWAYIDDLEALK